MTIGERIRYYRKNADMTQRELAATTGIHYVSICNYESGKMIPREDQIRKIADALGISYSSLNNPDSDTRRFQTLGNLFELLMFLGVMYIRYITIITINKNAPTFVRQSILDADPDAHGRHYCYVFSNIVENTETKIVPVSFAHCLSVLQQSVKRVRIDHPHPTSPSFHNPLNNDQYGNGTI